MRTLFAASSRSAGSRGWLANLYRKGVAGGRAYDGMWNDEAVLVETNAALKTRGADPDLQELAWSERGFRGKLGSVGRGGPAVEGLNQTVSSLVPMPDAPTMLALLERLTSPG